MAPRVLLVSSPMRAPDESAVSVATLGAILNREGIPTEELHGPHLFPFSTSQLPLWMDYPAFYFAPHLYDDLPIEQVVDGVVAHHIDNRNMAHVQIAGPDPDPRRLGIDVDQLRREIRDDIERAEVCLDRCVERILGGDYDVLGLSCTFEAQLVGGLAIAARIKRQRPDLPIVMGGAACQAGPGSELARAFPFLDAVCHTEGDPIISRLMVALHRNPRDLDGVPGVAWLDASGRLRRTPAPPLLDDLDQLPIPDFAPFLEQLAASEWAESSEPTLFFETSRGCWWGEKHLCTFCAVDSGGVTYRRKSADRAYREIEALHERYRGVRRLIASDNIIAMSYFKEVLPRLQELRRRSEHPLRLFYEVKSNLRRDQVAALAGAGVEMVQPGIESFSDHVLQLMDKGVTGLQQVRAVKHFYEHGIGVSYNLLVLNPGETAQDYREMTALLPYIEHLPPPNISTMWLERFSPYQTAPERYGVANLRAKGFYGLLLRGPTTDVERLAYLFDFDHPMHEDQELLAAIRELVAAIRLWRARWGEDMAYVLEDTGRRSAKPELQIVDRRGMWGERRYGVTGRAAALYRALDKSRPRVAIRRHFDDLSDELVDAALDCWLHRRWAVRNVGGDRTLAVLPFGPFSTPRPAERVAYSAPAA